jgi:CheY-like chemotaxis protein/anti-sigma regulatory factor (Ser/Thr protein kinase)
LNAILGWNRILSLKRGADPDVAAIAPRIEHSARAQLKMVNDLLDLGRIGSGKLSIEPRPLRLAKLIGSAVDLARPAAARKAIELVVQLAPDLGQTRADPERIQQVVGNLLSNAIKFTPLSGRITVSLRSVAGFIELSVADTGQGISPERLPHIFDRLRRREHGDPAHTSHSGGLGLGLTLVREIVALHGGSVSANSDGMGAGATFIVRLPVVTRVWSSAAAENAAGTSIDGSHGRSLGGLSILIVDDELDARTVVAESLRLAGATVTLSDSAGSAFQQLQTVGAHFDVVVSDIGMPDEDGYSLIRKLRGLEHGHRTLAIAVTGFASRNDVDAALNAGFDLHVPKPVDFSTFVPLVKRLAGTLNP